MSSPPHRTERPIASADGTSARLSPWSARAICDLALAWLRDAAMQRSKRGLAAPIGGDKPMRSHRIEGKVQSGKQRALSVTPRLRMLIRVMVVPGLAGHTTIRGMQPSSISCGSAASTQRRATNDQSFDAALPRGHRATEEIFEKSLVSLQTHLQGVDGATLAIVRSKCRHCAASFLKPAMSPKYPGPHRKASHALVGSYPKSPRAHAAGLASSDRSTPCARRYVFAKSGAGELARVSTRLRAAADQRVVVHDRGCGLPRKKPCTASQPSSDRKLRCSGLDALGNDRHFEAVAEIDDAANDPATAGCAEIHDEGAVDLDLVERDACR